jgi:hypothetical protein
MNERNERKGRESGRRGNEKREKGGLWHKGIAENVLLIFD